MSNGQLFHHYRIVWRPTLNIFKEEQIDLFQDFLKKENKYIISLEHGEKVKTINHIDIYIEFKKEIRKDKLKEKIIRLLKKHDICPPKTEIPIALKILPIRTNLEGVIGYSLKENNTKITKGFTEKELEYHKQKYIENTILDFNKKHQLRVNKKNLHIYFKRYILNKYRKQDKSPLTDKEYLVSFTMEDYEEITNKKVVVKQRKIKEPDGHKIIATILGEMGNDDYSLLWIDKRNIKDICYYLWSNINQNMETHFLEMLSFSESYMD